MASSCHHGCCYCYGVHLHYIPRSVFFHHIFHSHAPRGDGIRSTKSLQCIGNVLPSMFPPPSGQFYRLRTVSVLCSAPAQAAFLSSDLPAKQDHSLPGSGLCWCVKQLYFRNVDTNPTPNTSRHPGTARCWCRIGYYDHYYHFNRPWSGVAHSCRGSLLPLPQDLPRDMWWRSDLACYPCLPPSAPSLHPGHSAHAWNCFPHTAFFDISRPASWTFHQRRREVGLRLYYPDTYCIR